jgi:hypothetical protein
MLKKCFSVLAVTTFLIIPTLWNECNAGLFDHDDKLPGELLGYKQTCPVNRCTFSGVANGDLDIHMRQTHPKRYEAALSVYNKSTFGAFVGIFKTLSAASSGGFKGTAGAVQEFYNSLRKTGADGRTIANILSSDEYD